MHVIDSESDTFSSDDDNSYFNNEYKICIFGFHNNVKFR